MKVLFLTNNIISESVSNYLREINEEVYVFKDKLTEEIVKTINPDFTVSYNYKYIIKEDIIRLLNNKVINLHSSFLPYNKGSFPNFWSFIENTPKGVTIHKLVKELDGGEILAQKEVFFDEDIETFSSTYDKLCEAMFDLFVQKWKDIKNEEIVGCKQQGEGTFHLSADIYRFNNGALPNWDVKIGQYKKQILHKSRVLIYPLASEVIGLGHLMRCLSVAHEIKKLGGEALFLCDNTTIMDIVKQNNFTTVKSADEINADALLLDGYEFSAKQMIEYSAKFTVFYFDDIAAFRYPVDNVINYNIYADEFYSEGSQTAKMILGTKYVPLRSEFVGLPAFKVKNEVKNIFVSVGGADPLDISSALVSALCNSFVNCNIHLVVGAFANEFDNCYTNLVFHKNVTEMATLMRSCDVAVSAAGSTLYELCACGVPTISFYWADNQRPGALIFDEKGIITSSGDFRKDSKTTIDNIVVLSQQLCESKILRNKKSAIMQKVVDGEGAKRIAELICKIQ